jgi:hypothetical protein
MFTPAPSVFATLNRFPVPAAGVVGGRVAFPAPGVPVTGKFGPAVVAAPVPGTVITGGTLPAAPVAPAGRDALVVPVPGVPGRGVPLVPVPATDVLASGVEVALLLLPPRSFPVPMNQAAASSTTTMTTGMISFA